MATIQREPQVLDDLLYQRGQKVDANTNVMFAYGGKTYEIDLTEENAGTFDSTMQEYIKAAREVHAGQRVVRRASPGGTGKSVQTRTDRALTREIRDWARDQGMTVEDKGRIPTDVRQAFFRSFPDHSQHPSKIED